MYVTFSLPPSLLPSPLPCQFVLSLSFFLYSNSLQQFFPAMPKKKKKCVPSCVLYFLPQVVSFFSVWCSGIDYVALCACSWGGGSSQLSCASVLNGHAYIHITHSHNTTEPHLFFFFFCSHTVIHTCTSHIHVHMLRTHMCCTGRGVGGGVFLSMVIELHPQRMIGGGMSPNPVNSPWALFISSTRTLCVRG